jgi:hypothetical protein
LSAKEFIFYTKNDEKPNPYYDRYKKTLKREAEIEFGEEEIEVDFFEEHPHNITKEQYLAPVEVR